MNTFLDVQIHFKLMRESSLPREHYIARLKQFSLFSRINRRGWLEFHELHNGMNEEQAKRISRNICFLPI